MSLILWYHYKVCVYIGTKFPCCLQKCEYKANKLGCKGGLRLIDGYCYKQDQKKSNASNGCLAMVLFVLFLTPSPPWEGLK